MVFDLIGRTYAFLLFELAIEILAVAESEGFESPFLPFRVILWRCIQSQACVCAMPGADEMV